MEIEKPKWGKLEEKPVLRNVIRKFDPEKRGQYEVGINPLQIFPTSSIYAGQWSPVDMEGIGTYILPHGVVYEGNMKDGMFHGKGTLIYPMGQMVVGEWFEGEITSWDFKYKNIKQCRLDKYCKQPDRRFLTTLHTELRPAGKEHLTNEQPTRKIPKGCYDVVDGFYNPKTLWVHSSKDFSRILYMPAPGHRVENINIFKDDGAQFVRKIPFVPIYRTSEWIEENCRKAWDETTGYKRKLFEYWFTGREKERHLLDMKVESQGGKFVSEESMCDQLLRHFEKISENNEKRRRESLARQKIKYAWLEEKSDGESESTSISLPNFLIPPMDTKKVDSSTDEKSSTSIQKHSTVISN